MQGSKDVGAGVDGRDVAAFCAWRRVPQFVVWA